MGDRSKPHGGSGRGGGGSNINPPYSWMDIVSSTFAPPQIAFADPVPNGDDGDGVGGADDWWLSPSPSTVEELLQRGGGGPTPTPSPPMSMAVLILIIVASLSAVVGSIYLLIYFKSIKPMSARSRSYVEQGGKGGDDGGHRTQSAHPFFRRK